MRNSNYVYRLFDIMEEFGEDTDMVYALIRDDHDTPQWHYVRHQDMDGMGMFHQVLAQQGVTLKLPLYAGEVPGRLQRVRLAWRKFKSTTPAEVDWKSWQPSADGRVVKHAHPLQGIVLSVEDSQAILAHIKRRSVTANAYLLWALNAAVAPALTNGMHVRAWGNTVNLRGHVPAASVGENQSSIVTVQFGDATTVSQLHDILHDVFASGLHWGSWDFLSTVCRFGPGLVRKQIRRYYSSNNSQMGTFSSLGKWNWPTDQGAAPYLFFVPPCTRTAPIAAAAGSLNGRLVLCLGVHQFMRQTDAQVRDLLGEWVNRLLAG